MTRNFRCIVYITHHWDAVIFCFAVFVIEMRGIIATLWRGKKEQWCGWMLKNANQSAVSYPFVRSHDSQLVKSTACKCKHFLPKRDEWKKQNRKSLCATCSLLAPRFHLPTLTQFKLEHCLCEQFWQPPWRETTLCVFPNVQTNAFFLADYALLVSYLLQLFFLELYVPRLEFERLWKRQGHLGRVIYRWQAKITVLLMCLVFTCGGTGARQHKGKKISIYNRIFSNEFKKHSFIHFIYFVNPFNTFHSKYELSLP